MNRYTLTTILLALLALVFVMPRDSLQRDAAGQDAPATLNDAKSVTERDTDQQLLDDLQGDLLDDLEDIPAKSPTDRDGRNGLDERLLDELGDGEDIGPDDPMDPLSRIGRAMRSAEGKIAEQDTSDRTRSLQKQIVTDLAALIQRLKRQRSKPIGGGTPKSPGKTAARSAVQRPTPRSTHRPDAGRIESPEKAQRIWGHLPAKARQQMQNASGERFLPGYEPLIEDYFKRLAEDLQSSP